MRMKPTISTHNIQLLDPKLKDQFIVIPSSKIFYGNRPYKVSLNVHKPEEVLTGDSRLYHWWAWQDMLKISGANNNVFFRTQGRFPDMYLFMESYAGFELLVRNFADRINYISGPVSDEHLTKISGSRDIVVRKNLFWNKYRYKIDIFPSWKHGTYTKRLETVREIREFVKDNLVEGRMSPTSWRTSFFASEDEYKNILPFIKLQWPNIRIDYTEIYYPDSL